MDQITFGDIFQAPQGHPRQVAAALEQCETPLDQFGPQPPQPFAFIASGVTCTANLLSKQKDMG